MVKVKEISTEKIEDIIFSLWEPLTDNEKKVISENITVEEYNKNDYIYKELEIPESIKWLITGKVKICKSGAMGRDQILRTIRQSEIFSFRAYFAEDDYLTSAIAFEHSIVASMPMKLVVKLMHQNNNMSIYLSREELASMSNMTTSNAIRTLSAFAAEKIIAIDGRKIKIINENELKKISENG